jgi:hypothetical protein
MSKEAVIIYLSDTYKSEFYRTLLLSSSAGFLGGIINCAVQRKFAENTTILATNYVRLLIDYVSNGLLFGLGSGVLTYLLFMSYTTLSFKNIEAIIKISITFAILSPVLITIFLNLINKNIFQDRE